MAISMQRAVSEMWMKARVWPPVPYTVRGMFSDAWVRRGSRGGWELM
jgi:hypothetical protein